MQPLHPTLTLLAAGDGADPRMHGLSLLHGWFPVALQVVAAILLVAAVGIRTRRWWLVWLPVAVAVGGAAALVAHWYVDSEGLAGDPAPRSLWIWVGLSGVALVVLLVGWRGARWWRRGVSILAVPMCLLGTGVALNLWVGYFPTVQIAWSNLTAGDLPDQTDMAAVTAMRDQGAVPAHGAVVPVDIPSDKSHFKHRTEYVYLPPAWFGSGGASLPTVMMIAGEFNTTSDWPRTGNAIATLDTFAAAHGGYAPVFVFVDAGGSFNNDTECVDGPRGNVASHLTQDVVPYMESTFGVSARSANWGIVGWSMGGTCAVDLTVMHPDLFSAFVDIAGDQTPNAGTKEQTIARLYGGNADLWSTYDPASVMARHGRYDGVSGWFAVSSDKPPTEQEMAKYSHGTGTGLGGQDAMGRPGDAMKAATELCSEGRAAGMDCAVVPEPGKHTWPFATKVFSDSLPWLAGRLGTPQVPRTPLPAGVALQGDAADPPAGQ